MVQFGPPNSENCEFIRDPGKQAEKITESTVIPLCIATW